MFGEITYWLFVFESSSYGKIITLGSKKARNVGDKVNDDVFQDEIASDSTTDRNLVKEDGTEHEICQKQMNL